MTLELALSDVDVLPKLQAMMEDFGNAAGSELSVVLSAAIALQHVHHTHHWQTRGSQYYGDHLLFQRLYEEMDDEIDGLAERAIGLGSLIVAQPILVHNHADQIVQHMYAGAAPYPEVEALPLLSLRAEKCFMALLEVVYKLMEAKGALTMGADDLLQATASLHETHLYLLQQRSGGKMAERVARRAAQGR